MDIYVSRNKSVKYCDEEGVELLGNFSVQMPGKLDLKLVINLFIKF
jgi:hypothetical protein